MNGIANRDAAPNGRQLTGGRQLIVGISDAKVSQEPGSVLVTYALGSCVAVCMFDPVTRVGGLLHILLPESSLDAKKAEAHPYTFADTGVALILKQMVTGGAFERRIKVRLAGGAQVTVGGDLFNIGKRNHAAVRKALWKAGLMVDGELVGGDVSRTVRLEVDSGRFLVRESSGVEREIPLKDSRYGK